MLDASEILLDHLVETFSQLNKGYKDDSPKWCNGLIDPVFASGDPVNPINDRGIKVTGILAELHAMVVRPELQAGPSIVNAGPRGKQDSERTIVRQSSCLSYRLW